MNYYISVLKKYAVFKGRAQRAEYWYFALFNGIIGLILYFVSAIMTGTIGTIVGSLYIIYAFLVIIPATAVAIRRLHDTGRSGWWLLITFIPIVGTIIFLVFVIQDSQPGSNKYGVNPKEILGNQ
jgi:uncharacterized membrane protein YhaH (DUF805 family)